MLYLNKLKFRYNGRPVLRSVSVQIDAGDFVGIIGSNGSGKSTLLKCINGDLDAESGEIFWNKRQLKGPAWNLVPGHDSVKLVSQDARVAENMTVTENLAVCFKLRSKQYIRLETRRLLELVGLEKAGLKKPHELSGGQKQKLALARALCEKPEVLLLDEPFSQIDKYDTFRLLSELDQLRQREKILILLVTHDTEYTIRFCDEILVLENGRIVRRDTPREIYANPGTPAIAGLTGLYTLLDNVLYRPEHLQIEKSGDGEYEVVRTFKDLFFNVVECTGNGNNIYAVSSNHFEPGTQVKIRITP